MECICQCATRLEASRQDLRARAAPWLHTSSQRFGEQTNALDEARDAASRFVESAAFAPAATRSAATYVFVQPEALLKMGRAPFD